MDVTAVVTVNVMLVVFADAETPMLFSAVARIKSGVTPRPCAVTVVVELVALMPMPAVVYATESEIRPKALAAF